MADVPQRIDERSVFERWSDRAKRHPAAAALMIGVLAIGGLGTVLGAVKSCYDVATIVKPPASAAAAPAMPTTAPGMVLVPAGTYRHGSPRATRTAAPELGGTPAGWPAEEQDDAPAALGAFYIDQYEYPNVKGEVPKVSVTWDEAAALCAAAGKRLCTELEWEAACEGPDGRLFPYGVRFDSEACNATGTGEGSVAPAGAFERCLSPLGIYDLSGNVAEWTAGIYERNPKLVVARSGSFSNEVPVLRCANRIPKPRDFEKVNTGFRCCRSAG